jgi:hypothetical protein
VEPPARRAEVRARGKVAVQLAEAVERVAASRGAPARHEGAALEPLEQAGPLRVAEVAPTAVRDAAEQRSMVVLAAVPRAAEPPEAVAAVRDAMAAPAWEAQVEQQEPAWTREPPSMGAW